MISESKQLFSWFTGNKFDWKTPKDLYQKLNDELFKRNKAETALDLIDKNIGAHKRYLFNCNVIMELCKVKSLIRETK